MHVKIRILIVGVLIAVSAGLYAWKGRRAGASAEPTLIRVSGTIEVTDAELSFRIPGRLVTRPATEGETLVKGALAAQLDAIELAQDVALRQAELDGALADLAELRAGSRPEEIGQAEAALALARAEADRARIEDVRQRDLLARDAVAARDQEGAETAYAVARARVRTAEEKLTLLRKGARAEQVAQLRARADRARRALEIAQTRVEYATLTAPFSGIVLAEHLEPGEHVNPGTPVVTLGELEHVWLRAYIDETDLGRVHLGQQVSVTTDTFPDRRYSGRVSFIASEAEFTPKNVQTEKERVKLVYRIKVAIPNPKLELKPGMPADGDIRLGDGAHSRPVGEAR
jgi:HlyD family secretion protein